MFIVPNRAQARTLALALMLGLGGFGLAACDDPGPADDAGPAPADGTGTAPADGTGTAPADGTGGTAPADDGVGPTGEAVEDDDEAGQRTID